MYAYLALGDSYTIGEQVPMEQNFPYQTVKLLGNQHIDVAEPVIVATTGWTTDELAAAIRERNITGTYSFVTLLIGVNNQYRGRDVANYRMELEQLMNQAIAFADGKPNRVFVLSIPDWGVTPFAADRDQAKIAVEIDGYNAVKKELALAKGCHFIDITPSSREHGADPSFLTEDALHYSGKEYTFWSAQLADRILHELKH